MYMDRWKLKYRFSTQFGRLVNLSTRAENGQITFWLGALLKADCGDRNGGELEARKDYDKLGLATDGIREGGSDGPIVG